jgi:arylsulfatase A-like enzyme
MKRALIAAAMLLALPMWVLAEEPSRAAQPPNVLLITIDTLRADHLSCYGYRLLTSPNLDRLAAGGVRFASAYTTIPLTGPSHITMMTGLFPQQHGATVNGMHMGRQAQGHPPLLLAQILRRLRGYKTAAFVSAWPLKKGITGLGRGFDTYNQKFRYHYNLLSAARTAADVGPLSRQWLRKHAGESPFFLWVHYFDPHAPYELHPQFASLPANPAADQQEGSDSVEGAQAEKIRAYDSEIALTDNDIEKTLGLLQQEGVRKNTLIMVVADHGEALGEHGYYGHGNHADQPVIHVPMIVSLPGKLPEGKTITQAVSLVDVMPTILDYAGIKLGEAIAGTSLRPLIEQGSAAQVQPAFFVTYAEPVLHLPRWLTWMWSWAESKKRTPSRLGFIRGNMKIVLAGSKSPQVWQLRDQFKAERAVNDNPVISADAKLYGRFLSAWFQQTNTGIPAENRLSQKDIEMLHSLGYTP